MSSDNQHRQVVVKVNALADEGIADLVRAVNRFPRLSSTYSCEDPDGRGEEGAGLVSFTYGHEPEDVIRFCFWLADELWARLEEGVAVLVVCGPGMGATGQLRVGRHAMTRVVAEIDAIASRWNPDEEIAARVAAISLGD